MAVQKCIDCGTKITIDIRECRRSDCAAWAARLTKPYNRGAISNKSERWINESDRN